MTHLYQTPKKKRPNVELMLTAIEASNNHQELRANLLTAYEGMDEDSFGDVLAKALQLAEMNGYASVLDEKGDDNA